MCLHKQWLFTSVGVLTLLLTSGCGGGGGSNSGASGQALTPTPPSPTPPAGTDIVSTFATPIGWRYHETQHADGSIATRGYVRDDTDGETIQVGPFLRFHANGLAAAEGHFDADGVKVGWWHEWHDTGKLQREALYVNGEMDRNSFWVERAADGSWLGGHNGS